MGDNNKHKKLPFVTRSNALTKMESKSDSTSNNINDFFSHIERLLLQIWQETGFGCLSIECDRLKDKKIRIIIKGGTHYRYVITDEEIMKWAGNKSLRS